MSAQSAERRQGLAMVSPAVIALLAIAAYPVLHAVWLSLHRFILVFGERRFIGTGNFNFLLEDDRFWTALRNTAYFSLVAVSCELLLGLGFALLLHSSFRGRSWVRAAVLVPWAIPTVVSAKMWLWLLNPDAGLFAGWLIPYGENWLGTPGYAMHAAILVDVWKTTPFVALLLLAGLQSIPEELYRAARVDGLQRCEASGRLLCRSCGRRLRWRCCFVRSMPSGCSTRSTS
jgi:multiple sugar transport system permease protein